MPAVGQSARDAFRTSPGVTGSSLVVSRAAFEGIGGFDPELPVQNDRDFFLRFLLAGGRYAVVGEPLVPPQPHERSEEKRAVSQGSSVQGLAGRAWASIAHTATGAVLVAQ